MLIHLFNWEKANNKNVPERNRFNPWDKIRYRNTLTPSLESIVDLPPPPPPPPPPQSGQGIPMGAIADMPVKRNTNLFYGMELTFRTFRCTFKRSISSRTNYKVVHQQLKMLGAVPSVGLVVYLLQLNRLRVTVEWITYLILKLEKVRMIVGTLVGTYINAKFRGHNA